MLKKINIKSIFILSLNAFFCSTFGAEDIGLSLFKKDIAGHEDRLHEIEQFALVCKSGELPQGDWFSRIARTARIGQDPRAQKFINLAINGGIPTVEKDFNKETWDHEMQQLAEIVKCAKSGDIDSILRHVSNSRIVKTSAAIVSVEEWTERLEAFAEIRRVLAARQN